MPFVVRGLGEVERILKALPDQIEKNTARRAMRRGAKVLQEGAQARVRRKSGKTAKAVKISSGVRKGMVQAKIQLRGEHSYIGWFLEYGTVPHWITTSAQFEAAKFTKGGARASLKIGERFVGQRVLHPGIPADKFPFFRPTVDQDGQKAIQAVKDYIAADLVSRGFANPYSEEEGDE